MDEPRCGACVAYSHQDTHRGVCDRWRARSAMWGLVMPEFVCALFQRDERPDIERAAELLAAKKAEPTPNAPTPGDES